MAISQYGNEYYGLSGDVKPLGTPLNGRKFTEMDTSKEYCFDAENQQWLQQSGGGGGGSSTLSGLTDVGISNPTDGQTLVYNATSGKWENGAGGGGGDMFVTLGTISAATVPMTYDEGRQEWAGKINTDIIAPSQGGCAGRNLALKIDGQLYSAELVQPNVNVDIGETSGVYLRVQADEPITLFLVDLGSNAPVITDVSMEVYAPSPELAVFLGGGNPK